MLNNKWTRTAASACMVTALLTGWAMVSTSAALAQAPGAAVRGLPDFTDLVEMVGPSVVNIRTIDKAATSPVAGGPNNGGPNSGGPSDEELQDDIAYLRKAWALVRERATSRPAGTLLHQDLSLAERVLREQFRF